MRSQENSMVFFFLFNAYQWTCVAYLDPSCIFRNNYLALQSGLSFSPRPLGNVPKSEFGVLVFTRSLSEFRHILKKRVIDNSIDNRTYRWLETIAKVLLSFALHFYLFHLIFSIRWIFPVFRLRDFYINRCENVWRTGEFPNCLPWNINTVAKKQILLSRCPCEVYTGYCCTSSPFPHNRFR